MLFGGQTRVGSKHYVLGGGALWRHLANTIEQSVGDVIGWTVQNG